MTDRPFQRPGSAPQHRTGSRLYHSPTAGPEPLPAESVFHDVVEFGHGALDPVPHEPVRQHGSRWRAPIVAAVGGCVVGALVTGLGVMLYLENPAPLSISPDTFPEYVLGIQRADLAAKSAGDDERLRDFTASFQEQLPTFLFVHGGPGATVGYGQSFTMTIVDGRQSLPLPSVTGSSVDVGSPTLVSLDTEEVSCVFLPTVELYDSAVLGASADLTARGRTDCVLNDRQRGISLRLTSLVPGGAAKTSADFAQVLERTHRDLTD